MTAKRSVAPSPLRDALLRSARSEAALIERWHGLSPQDRWQEYRSLTLQERDVLCDCYGPKEARGRP